MRIDRRNAAPGWSYAFERIRQILSPNVAIAPPPGGVNFERDVAVPMRDGTILRVNVFRPHGDGPFPVVMCAHPYGKDALPKPRGRGYAPLLQFRIMRQPMPPHFSAWTGWESPDPAFWTAHGYAVVNADLRGFGHSDGVGELLSAQEAQDYYELIEWAGTQPWSTGRVGLNGVSYLALSQWMVAALRPPHLAAICPWEGFSDCYRDFARPGGVREDGFLPLWAGQVARVGRIKDNLRAEQLARPLFDEWWAARCAVLERIDVPALICGSFSDQGLHSRGSIEAFRRIGSREKWLYTHRGGKWATYYSDEALGWQRRFFDCFLKGEENGMRAVPPVRLEVRSDRESVSSVRGETQWPLEGTRWTPLYLAGNGDLAASPAPLEETQAIDARSGTASFVWKPSRDVEICGPMMLQLGVSLEGCDDATLFAFVRKIDRNGVNVPFEGSYGFGYDVVAKGSLKLSLRALDEAKSSPWQPVYPFAAMQRLAPGEIVTVRVEILSSATLFRAGEALQLDVRGRWLYAHRNPPIRGAQFYETGPAGRIVLHLGGAGDAHLLVPLQLHEGR
ncbi:MAG TPA: CocE/NonD family hydrolase [Verrucomicrobiae bacterium]|nr:CocE/NonD family hydrolase [Verrucomicrobiae bacterium]